MSPARIVTHILRPNGSQTLCGIQSDRVTYIEFHVFHPRRFENGEVCVRCTRLYDRSSNFLNLVRRESAQSPGDGAAVLHLDRFDAARTLCGLGITRVQRADKGRYADGGYTDDAICSRCRRIYARAKAASMAKKRRGMH